VMSASHSRFGPSAVKFRRTRSSWTGGPALALVRRLVLPNADHQALSRQIFPRRSGRHRVAGPAGFVVQEPIPELGIITMRVEQGVRPMSLGESRRTFGFGAGRARLRVRRRRLTSGTRAMRSARSETCPMSCRTTVCKEVERRVGRSPAELPVRSALWDGHVHFTLPTTRRFRARHLIPSNGERG